MLRRTILNEVKRTAAHSKINQAWPRTASSLPGPLPPTEEEIERDVERRLSAIKRQREIEEAERAVKLEDALKREKVLREADKVEKAREAELAQKDKAKVEALASERRKKQEGSRGTSETEAAAGQPVITASTSLAASVSASATATSSSSTATSPSHSSPSQDQNKPTLKATSTTPNTSPTLSALQTQATLQALALSQALQKQITELRSALTAQRNLVSSRAKTEFAQLGGKINHLTGYDEVERLKDDVVRRENEIGELRTKAKAAKLAYEQAVQARSTSQRDVTSLLERKHTWTDADVVHFTSLVRSDHTSNHLVNSTSAALESAEQAVDTAFSQLMRSILTRYHEEQVWSDKIRNLSTYAGLVAVAANLVVFLTAIVFVEPWKRRRLVQGLEERVEGMMGRMERVIGEEIERVEIKIGAVQETLASQAHVASVHEPQPPTVLPAREDTGTLVDSPAPPSPSSFLSLRQSIPNYLHQVRVHLPTTTPQVPELSTSQLSGALGGIAFATACVFMYRN